MALNKTKKWEGYVSRDTLPVRKKPSAKAEEYDYSPIPKGTKVRVCDTKSGWLYIEVDGKYGYVSANYIKFNTPKRITPSKTVKWIGKITGSCYARAWASKYDAAVFSLKKGNMVSVLDTIDAYYYVQYGSKYAFVPQGKIKYSSEPEKTSAKAQTFLKAVADVQEYARTHNYIYADSQSTVPTADKKISCDRLVARALWNMGYTDQPKGGLAFRHDINAWFIKHKFKKSTSMAAVKAGSIMVVMNPSGTSRHMFVVASRKGNSYTRYDCGSLGWIRSKQPLQGLWMSKLIAVYNIT